MAQKVLTLKLFLEYPIIFADLCAFAGVTTLSQLSFYVWKRKTLLEKNCSNAVEKRVISGSVTSQIIHHLHCKHWFGTFHNEITGKHQWHPTRFEIIFRTNILLFSFYSVFSFPLYKDHPARRSPAELGQCPAISQQSMPSICILPFKIP